MSERQSKRRLPRNFHKTFKPERQYIHAMLRYAASGRQGDYAQIAEVTGIPTGTSSGKVPAILDYCRGMGLLKLVQSGKSSVKRPELTNFGRIVLLEDPFLKLEVSQWVAHLNLCSPLTGADVWYHTFFAGTHILGMTFERARLESYLGLVYGVDKGGLVGPLIGTYEDESALGICRALTETEGTVRRKVAPISNETVLGYGAWLVELLADHFPQRRQVSIAELDSTAGFRTIPGWDVSQLHRVLDMLARKGVIDVDRHMEPWLVAAACSPEQAWKRLYEDVM